MEPSGRYGDRFEREKKDVENKGRDTWYVLPNSGKTPLRKQAELNDFA
jgi:hypothetical protein